MKGSRGKRSKNNGATDNNKTMGKPDNHQAIKDVKAKSRCMFLKLPPGKNMRSSALHIHNAQENSWQARSVI
jgi:hypothetical protein